MGGCRSGGRGNGVWHVKQRAAHWLPPVTLNVEADWGKSGWHGWVYGWKLHLASIVAGWWIPLATALTKASVHDATVSPALLEEVPYDTRYVLGDTHYQTPDLHDPCDLHGRTLIASRWTPAPATDPGTLVRAVFHALRHAVGARLHLRLSGRAVVSRGAPPAPQRRYESLLAGCLTTCL